MVKKMKKFLAVVLSLVLLLCSLPGMNVFAAKPAAALSSLSVNEGSLNPVFDPSVTSYAVTVPGTAGAVTISAAASSGTIKVNSKTMSGTTPVSISLDTLPKTISVSISQSGKSSTTYKITVSMQPLEVLEVQPGMEFELSESMFSSIAENREVDITQMSMPEFVSRIEDINGLYDIVYIGNESDGGITYSSRGEEPRYLPYDVAPPNNLNSVNGIQEYYSGNDITDRRAKRLQEFIESGQLVIFDDSIFKDPGLVESKLYRNFIKYRTNADYPNFKALGSLSQVQPLPAFTGEYYGHMNLNPPGRPVFTRQDPVINFDWEDGSPDSRIRDKNFSVRWTGHTNIQSSGKYTFSLTVDGGARLYVNGNMILDSRKDEGLQTYTVDTYLSKGTNCEIVLEYYEHKGDASVTLAWGNPVTFDSAINCYATALKRPFLAVTSSPKQYNGNESDYEASKALGFSFDAYSPNSSDPMSARLYIDINGDGMYQADELVSQVDRITNGKGLNTSLNYRMDEDYTGLMPWKLELVDTSGPEEIKAYVTGSSAFKGEPLNVRVLHLMTRNNWLPLSRLQNYNGKNYLIKDGEYNIQVTELDIYKFNDSYPNPVKIPASGSTPAKTVPTELNGNYDMVVIGFEDSQSGSTQYLDREAPRQALIDYINTNQSVMFTHDALHFRIANTDRLTHTITEYFRSLIGQDIYQYDPMPDPSKMSYGFTTTMLDQRQGSDPTTTKAYKLNDGLISQYPYKLGDRYNEINVSATHYQYFQLNLEDERLVPWYTLTGSGYNKYDGRNEYYTYSLGNVTYSGTGHSLPGGSNGDEIRLFVNTMIKASRGANHAPSVQVYSLTDGQNIPPSVNKMDFSIMASDIDAKDRYLNADIYVDADNSGTYSPSEKLLSISSSSKLLESGVQKTLSVPLNIPQSVSSFKVKVSVYDSSSAKAEKEITLTRIAAPTLNLTNNTAGGYLVGDTAAISLGLHAEGVNDIMQFRDIKLDTTLDRSSFDISSSAGWSSDASGSAWTATLANMPPWGDQSRSISLLLKKPGRYTVPYSSTSTLYNLVGGSWVAGSTGSISGSYLVDVKSGKIDVEVKRGNNGLIGVPVTITHKASGRTYTGITGPSGLYSADGLSSGEYEVSITAPQGYTATASRSITNLSYGTPAQNVQFQLSAESDPITGITLTDSNGRSQVAAQMLEKPDGSYRNLTQAVNAVIGFTITKPIEAASIILNNNVPELLYTSTALRLENVSEPGVKYTCSRIGNTITLPANLPVGSYRLTVDMNIGNNISEGSILDISSVVIKEPSLTNSEAYDYFGAPLAFIPQYLGDLVGNAAIKASDGSSQVNLFESEEVAAKVEFTLSRSSDSTSITLDPVLHCTTGSPDTPWSSVTSVTLTREGSTDVYSAPVVNGNIIALPSGLTPGTYLLDFTLDAGSGIANGSSYNLVLQSVNASEYGIDRSFTPAGGTLSISVYAPAVNIKSILSEFNMKSLETIPYTTVYAKVSFNIERPIDSMSIKLDDISSWGGLASASLDDTVDAEISGDGRSVNMPSMQSGDHVLYIKISLESPIIGQDYTVSVSSVDIREGSAEYSFPINIEILHIKTVDLPELL